MPNKSNLLCQKNPWQNGEKKIYRNKYNYLQFIADIQNETFRNYDD